MKSLLIAVLLSLTVALRIHAGFVHEESTDLKPIQTNEEATDENLETVREELTELISLLKKFNAIKNTNSNTDTNSFDTVKQVEKKKRKQVKRLLLVHHCKDKCDELHDSKSGKKKSGSSVVGKITNECLQWCEVESSLDQVTNQERRVSKNEHVRTDRTNNNNEKNNGDNADDDKDGGDDDNDVGDNDDDVCGRLNCTYDLFNEFSQLEALIQPIDDSTLKTVCKALDDDHSCLQRVESECTDIDPDFQTIWTGISDSISYICGNGKKGLAKFQKCLTTNNVNYFTYLYTCLGYLSNMTDIEICSNVAETMNCFITSAQESCDSLDFVKTYFTEAVKPIVDFYIPDCSLPRKESKKQNLIQALKRLLRTHK